MTADPLRVLAAMSGGVDSAVAAARAAAGRPRRHRRAPGAVQRTPAPTGPARAAAAPSRTPATPAAPPTSSASRSTSGTWPSASTTTSSATSSTSTPAATPPTRACAATRRSSSPPCWTGPSPSASTPSAPATTPGSTPRLPAAGPAPPAAQRRPRQGPVLRAGRAHQPAARAGHVPARRHHQGAGPPGGRRARPGRGRQARQPRRLLHRRRRHQEVPAAASSAARPGSIVDAGGAVVGSHDGSYGFTVGQRKGLGIDNPALGWPAALRAGHRAGVPHRDRRRRERPGRPGDRGQPSGLVGLRTPPASRSTAWCSCARTASRSPATCEADGDVLRIRLQDPARGIARGQAAVLYDRDTVLGSATISVVSRSHDMVPPSS